MIGPKSVFEKKKATISRCVILDSIVSCVIFAGISIHVNFSYRILYENQLNAKNRCAIFRFFADIFKKRIYANVYTYYNTYLLRVRINGLRAMKM